MYLQTKRKIIKNGVTVNSQSNIGAFTAKPGWGNTNDSLALISIICEAKIFALVGAEVSANTWLEAVDGETGEGTAVDSCV